MTELRCEELAARLGISPRAVFGLLDEDLERGLVERDTGGRWRLTATAEAAFGQALRDLAPLEQANPHVRERRTRLAYPRARPTTQRAPRRSAARPRRSRSIADA